MHAMTRRQWLAAALVQSAAAQVDPEIHTLAGRAPLRMLFRGEDAPACRRWQRAFGTRLRQLLGPYDPPTRWETVEEGAVEFEDHTRHALLLRADGFPDLPVYILAPQDAAGRRPGILALHGHGNHGYDAVAGVAATEDARREIENLHYDYGLHLVRRGYVVAAPCFTPFGRRLGDRKAYGGQDPCAVTFVRMQLLGRVLMAENLRDALWSLELLAHDPRVDPSRLGCAGLSYGGRMTMLTTALSPKLRVAVISGALNVMQERVLGRYSCGAQVIPGLLEWGDVPEIASLIAPRPCLWEVGNNDPLMVQDRIGPALARLERAWHAFEASAELRVDRFEGRHEWHGTMAYPLLDRVLKP